MNLAARNPLAKAGELLSGLEKEASVLRTLHKDVQATLKRLEKQVPALRQRLESARGYAVFPAIGKAAAVLGVAYGTGEVFEQQNLIGYAGVAQLTIGIQIGGDTFAEILLFESKHSLNRFKQGRLAFSASAAAALVKAAARGAADYEKGVAALAWSQGGMLLEAAIGAQKFVFKPAALGRLKSMRASHATTTAPRRRSHHTGATSTSVAAARKRSTQRARIPSRSHHSRAAES